MRNSRIVKHWEKMQSTALYYHLSVQTICCWTHRSAVKTGTVQWQHPSFHVALWSKRLCHKQILGSNPSKASFFGKSWQFCFWFCWVNGKRSPSDVAISHLLRTLLCHTSKKKKETSQSYAKWWTSDKKVIHSSKSTNGKYENEISFTQDTYLGQKLKLTLCEEEQKMCLIEPLIAYQSQWFALIFQSLPTGRNWSGKLSHYRNYHWSDGYIFSGHTHLLFHWTEVGNASTKAKMAETLGKVTKLTNSSSVSTLKKERSSIGAPTGSGFRPPELFGLLPPPST